MEPFFNQLSAKYSDVNFVKIDVDDLPDVAREFGVTAMPTFVLLKQGKEVLKVIGAKKDELEKQILKHREGIIHTRPFQEVLSYGRNRSVILEAPKSDPECVLGNNLAAHFLCSSGSARQLIEAAKSQLEQGSSYEKAVIEAFIYLISLDIDDDVAVEMHSKLLQDFPRDLASLKRAQVLCFYMALLIVTNNISPPIGFANKCEDYICGMLAFALLELGRVEDAEEASKRGFEINHIIGFQNLTR
ncbi:hypothetical protein OROHE_013061 [Orobanche hederae]